MKIIKIITELEGSLFLENTDMGYSDHWLQEVTQPISKNLFYTSDMFNSSPLFFEGITEKNYFEFQTDSYGMKLRVKHQIPEDMIHHTRCAFITSISKIEDNSYSSLHYSMTKIPLIRIMFDGPDDLGLIWRLSI